MKKVDYPSIVIKSFTKKLLGHTSKSVKLKEKVIVGLVSDIFKNHELIVGTRFTLEEDEKVFELERAREREIHGNRGTNVRIEADTKIMFKELSEKSGIPIWKIADNGLRLMLKYEYFTRSIRKWRKSIREAIKRQSSREDESNGETQLKKIDFEARARAQPENRILGLGEEPRVIAKSRRAREKRKTKLMLH